MCPKRESHDWEKCIYAHRGEKARRRHPSKYQAVQCPESRAKKVCPRGEDCPCTHHLFEYWLHPDRYLTCLCELGPSCNRPICFFAHERSELRALPPGLTNAQDIAPGPGSVQQSSSPTSCQSEEAQSLAGVASQSLGQQQAIKPGLSPVSIGNSAMAYIPPCSNSGSPLGGSGQLGDLLDMSSSSCSSIGAPAGRPNSGLGPDGGSQNSGGTGGASRLDLAGFNALELLSQPAEDTAVAQTRPKVTVLLQPALAGVSGTTVTDTRAGIDAGKVLGSGPFYVTSQPTQQQLQLGSSWPGSLGVGGAVLSSNSGGINMPMSLSTGYSCLESPDNKLGGAILPSSVSLIDSAVMGQDGSGLGLMPGNLPGLASGATAVGLVNGYSIMTSPGQPQLAPLQAVDESSEHLSFSLWDMTTANMPQQQQQELQAVQLQLQQLQLQQQEQLLLQSTTAGMPTNSLAGQYAVGGVNSGNTYTCANAGFAGFLPVAPQTTASMMLTAGLNANGLGQLAYGQLPGNASGQQASLQQQQLLQQQQMLVNKGVNRAAAGPVASPRAAANGGNGNRRGKGFKHHATVDNGASEELAGCVAATLMQQVQDLFAAQGQPLDAAAAGRAKSQTDASRHSSAGEASHWNTGSPVGEKAAAVVDSNVRGQNSNGSSNTTTTTNNNNSEDSASSSRKLLRTCLQKLVAIAATDTTTAATSQSVALLMKQLADDMKEALPGSAVTLLVQLLKHDNSASSSSIMKGTLPPAAAATAGPDDTLASSIDSTLAMALLN
eukprot:GHRR01010427.1.p1 GENE.GHRR01010427.1~~GHRR01010427.1.p1  ORF type:complete len:775 (+),score=333.86 GHRR01010427.1:462-2786(+)